MPDQILIGNFANGLKKNPNAFNIDNDAFPTLFNFYAWRGTVKRKRGTTKLARLQKQVQSVLNAAPPTTYQVGELALIAGVRNILQSSISNITQATNAVVTINGSIYTPGLKVNISGVVGMTQINGGPYTILAVTPTTLTLNVNSTGFTAYASGGTVSLTSGQNVTPGSIRFTVGGDVYTEPATPDGTLLKNAVVDPGSTINYATGVVTIAGATVGPLIGTFSYFPDLPVLGLEDFVLNTINDDAPSSKFPLLIGFDTTYAYQLNQAANAFFYNISYYKGSNNPLIWSNDNSAQFWSTNYQSAFWVTNNKSGLHFLNGTYTSGSGTKVITFNFKSGGVNFTKLVIGDVLWFNEWNAPTVTITGATQATACVLTATNTFAPGDKITIQGVIGMTQLNIGIFTITAATGTTITLNVNSTNFDDYISGGTATLVVADTINGVNGTVSNIAGAATGDYIVTFADNQTVSGTGIVQMLTNSIVGQDGIRWYDGDPTGNSGIPTGTGLGWVNFAPPLTAFNVGINDQVVAKYYLVGALAILPFKDRLLFFGPQIQSISGVNRGPLIQKPMQDTVLWSWNGTPYYNELVPTNATGTETFDARAYYVDQSGLGGYLPAGISQPLISVMNNEDVLLIGFGGAGKKTRFVYTGNDLQPFLFYLIDSELPSSSTFSSVVLDKGGIDIGQYGITMTTQQECQRIDLDIPDDVFTIQSLNNGQNRVNAIRDFYREWIYFSYPTGDGKETNQSWIFPSQTFLFNYRNNTWAIFRENFTHHGTYRKSKHYTWATLPFKTWATWKEPWNAGSSVSFFAEIIAGNPQGYVLVKSEGTEEAPSGYISAIANDGFGFTQITSVNHCVNSQPGDQGVNGDYLSFGNDNVGGESIGLVSRVIDVDNFVVDIPYSTSATITAATKATKAVLTITFTTAPLYPTINSFFVGQRVSIAGVVGMTQLNGNTYTVFAVSPTTITLIVDSSAFGTYVSGGTVTLVGYIGTGTYTRLSQPLFSTKQFPLYWQEGRQVRLGVQKYLMDYTANGQVSLNINLSQDPDNIYNIEPLIPSLDVLNSGLIYTQVLYTCPESSNLGLTPANTNLQMPTAQGQWQIWHRVNTSLIGDTFQVGMTLNDVQMRNLTYATSEIAVNGMQFTVDRGPQLS